MRMFIMGFLVAWIIAWVAVVIFNLEKGSPSFYQVVLASFVCGAVSQGIKQFKE